jgi:hypothetical protein
VALKFDQSLFEGSICVERVFIHLSFREEVHRGALAGYLPLAPNRMHRSAKRPNCYKSRYPLRSRSPVHFSSSHSRSAAREISGCRCLNSILERWLALDQRFGEFAVDCVDLTGIKRDLLGEIVIPRS